MCDFSPDIKQFAPKPDPALEAQKKAATQASQEERRKQREAEVQRRKVALSGGLRSLIAGRSGGEGFVRSLTRRS